MTLAIASVSAHSARVVADERLMNLATGLAEDNHNKVVALGGHSTFTYSGLGRFADSQTVDQWLAHELTSLGEGLRSPHFQVAVEHIRKAATARFAQEAGHIPPAQHRHLVHAFVGIGAVPGRGNALAIISNTANDFAFSAPYSGGLDNRFKFSATPRPEFRTSIVEPISPVILPIGVDSSTAKDLLKAALSAVRRDLSDDIVLRLLKKAIKLVSTSSNYVSPGATEVASSAFVTERGVGISSGRASHKTIQVHGTQIIQNPFQT